MKMLIIAVLLLLSAAVIWAEAPTTLEDFHLAGTQPNQVAIEAPNRCGNCHGGYDPTVEPYTNWQGSMMAQSMRDPLFRAFMTIANQDAPESGDLCIRCHTPEGWLEGRSVPTDGSALNSRDYNGITCDFCHKLVKPTPLGVNPYPADPGYTVDIYNTDQNDLANLADIPPMSGNGMYVVSGSKEKRGPFLDAKAKHQMFYSPFHKEAALCGTCHDVSNPAFDRNLDDTYTANDFGVRTPSYDTYDIFPIERTYSEWLMSEYNTPDGVYAPQFGGNKDTVSTCQDCHMRDVTGYGCNKAGTPLRPDQPLHDLTGGNTFVPKLVGLLYPADVIQSDLDAGIQRATAMLQKAATMNVSVTPSGTDFRVNVHVINETGHKLPSGYPEGRRIWINIKAFDDAGTVVYESGAYDNATGILNHDDDVKIYEIKPGISADLALLVGLPSGPSFHFVLNNQIYKDNRIPPRGFTNENFQTIQSPPVGYSYEDGQHSDSTQYIVPGTTKRVEVTLYYQTTSKEFIEFLRSENQTDTLGELIYNLWNDNGKSAPVAMNTETVHITANSPVADFTGTPTSGNSPLTVSFTDLSTENPTAWNWDFGDGNTSTEQNPNHTYTLTGVYTVQLTAFNFNGSNTLTKTDYINVTDFVQIEMHVDLIVVSNIPEKGSRFTGIAEVTVLDQDNNPVAGALVTGDFSGAVSNTAFGTTDAGGIATITSRSVKNPPSEFCFTVTDISLPDAVYDPAANNHTTACESGPVAKYADKLQLLPDKIYLAQNYPNPFNPTTEIDLYLPYSTNVKIEIFNIKGQLVTTLYNGFAEAGHQTVVWDAAGNPSGVYLYRLIVDDYNETKKMILLK